MCTRSPTTANGAIEQFSPTTAVDATKANEWIPGACLGSVLPTPEFRAGNSSVGLCRVYRGGGRELLDRTVRCGGGACAHRPKRCNPSPCGDLRGRQHWR